ncbi:phospholipase A [Grimontia sp. NTOU-MAR1]|uniref:phospholipase A n=1 Tax=Grimontia sp. NTOU-MAR1 TaxID=3111011 RepID=UPI002DB67863|nr:phospholipase A [Grimontia sp. NTOU-MAR1]WRV99774.1 phospholipase A [Grimontia sp. NTOU-MAR1]
MRSFSLTLGLVTGCGMMLIPLLATAAEGLSAHKDNYLLPFYKERHVNQERFEPLNPNDTEAKDTFVQFQFSVKYRLLEVREDGLYLAYTQRSNWEAYDTSAYFRDSAYNPELFYRLNLESWQVDIGAEHESNGAGGDNEVSWNRVYIDARRYWDWGYVSFKPWLRVGDVAYNPDISDYLGYGRLEVIWQPADSQDIKLTISNLFADDLDYLYYGISWNFPIYQGLRGYMKAETGYGLTISNYNFDDTAYGLGVAFNF